LTKRRNKGFRNKDPRYIKKIQELKKKLRYFYLKESKAKHGKEFRK